MALLRKDFEYDLPEELIAQSPLPDRSASRLLVLPRYEGSPTHGTFRDLPRYLSPGDLLVLNDSRVLPARLIGRRETGGRCELLLLHPRGDDCWQVLGKPARKLPVGSRITFGDGEMTAVVLEKGEAGELTVRFSYSGEWEERLSQLGKVPLPPYIRRQVDDPERYQTVYARHEGSVAAPTAGLHFTQELLQELQGRGVAIAYLTLHVGVGTFRPVQVENIEEHRMHAEYYHVPEETARAVSEARRRGGRVVAVGTTVTRTLESCAAPDGTVRPGSGWSDLFIYPGYRFKVIDGLLTNFHLPGSTLLMLVSAFAGRERVLQAYQEAIERRYRFFSFGDAMLIL